jgi:hypothetical protein
VSQVAILCIMLLAFSPKELLKSMGLLFDREFFSLGFSTEELSEGTKGV